MRLLGQRGRLRNRIAADDRKILWINLTAPSLGDALMDTSGRVLLKGREVHLLTHPKNAELFAGDEIFSRVFTLPEEAREEHQRRHYDLVLVDSFSPRSLRPKIQIDSTLPFVGLYGFLNGFEIHRTFFSFGRLAKLLSLSGSEVTRARLTISLGQSQLDAPPKVQENSIAVGIGGEWSFRTYSRWREVIELLPPEWPLVMLGSSNGKELAEQIEERVGRENLQNLVGHTSLEETCWVLRRCQIYIGADGGLWHLASACELPSVVVEADCQLFDKHRHHKGRHTAWPPCESISATWDVNEISPKLISQSVWNLLQHRLEPLENRSFDLTSA